MAEEISGEGFLNLLDTKITPLSGGNEKITLADQLEKSLSSAQDANFGPGAKSELPPAGEHGAPISRDIYTAAAAAAGYSDPMKTATDQELDIMMMDQGTEVLRGANKESLEKLALPDSQKVPSSAYNEGGEGLYMTIEAASPDTRARLDLPKNADFSSTHYADKEGYEGAVIRAVLPSDAKVMTGEQSKAASKQAMDRVTSELLAMNQSDSRVQRALNILEKTRQIRSDSPGSGIGEILAGVDATTIGSQSNELRLLNRSIAFTSGAKSPEQMKELYPETQKGSVGNIRRQDGFFNGAKIPRIS